MGAASFINVVVRRNQMAKKKKNKNQVTKNLDDGCQSKLSINFDLGWLESLCFDYMDKHWIPKISHESQVFDYFSGRPWGYNKAIPNNIWLAVLQMLGVDYNKSITYSHDIVARHPRNHLVGYVTNIAHCYIRDDYFLKDIYREYYDKPKDLFMDKSFEIHEDRLVNLETYGRDYVEN